jgi:hypothetical protein
MRLWRLPLLPLCAALFGCAPGFDIAPAEVPNLAGRRVRTTSEAEVDVPARWVATVVPHDGGDVGSVVGGIAVAALVTDIAADRGLVR